MEHEGVPRKRTSTSRFTENQLSILNKRSRIDPHIKKLEKEITEQNLGVPQGAIKNWFKSKRKRQRRHLANKASNASVL